MNAQALDKKIIHSLNYNHLGLCIFSEEDFFHSSALSTSTKYLLNWKTMIHHEFGQDQKLRQSLFVTNLYNKTFPILVSAERKNSEELSKYFQGLLNLIAGLCTHTYETSIELQHPKIMLLIDSTIEKNYQDALKKAGKNSTIQLTTPYFTSDKSLCFDILDISRP